jgi:hypothetical protein
MKLLELVKQKNIKEWESVLQYKLKISKEDAQDYIQMGLLICAEKYSNKDAGLGFVWGVIWNTAFKWRDKKIKGSKYKGELVLDDTGNMADWMLIYDPEQESEGEAIISCSRELLEAAEVIIEKELGPVHSQIFRFYIYTGYKAPQISKMSGVSRQYILSSWSKCKILLSDIIKMNDLKTLAEKWELGRAF